MGLQIEKRFTVRAPRSAVWEFLTNPYKVASCLPGAAITEKLDDATYGGTITVKLGPVTASYRGKMRFARLDMEAGEAEIAASGQETRGKGGADMRMKSRVVALGPGETEVTVVSDVNVMGVLAQFGRGMIQDVSDLLFQKFTEAMRSQLEGPAAAAVAGTSATAPAAGSTAAASAAAPAATFATAPTAPWPAPDPASAAATPSGPAPAPTGGSGAAAEAGSASSPAAAAPFSEPSPALSPASPPPQAAPVQPAAAPLDVGALGAAAAGRAAVRTLQRPGFWVVLGALFLIVYWWFFR
jgi:carbon monoxide dehydrogenase subunit G